jgi:DNA-binding transcriptional regulator YdaS (Cro superfamily)
MTIDDEVRRATKLLETVMQASGLTRKDLDLKLGAGPGYVSQVLTGRMELKFRHVLAVLRALEVEPNVFFQTLYPEHRPATDAVVMEEFLRRFQKLGFGSQSAPPPSPTVDPRELEQMIQNAVRAALTGLPGGEDTAAEDPEPPQPSPENTKPRGRKPRGGSKPSKPD